MLENGIKSDPGGVRSQRYPHDGETTSDVLTQEASNHTTPTLHWTELENHPEAECGKTYVMAPQFPIIVATVELNFENPLLSCR